MVTVVKIYHVEDLSSRRIGGFVGLVDHDPRILMAIINIMTFDAHGRHRLGSQDASPLMHGVKKEVL